MRFGCAEPLDRFSLVLGDPFHRMLHHLGLTGEDQLPTLRAALILALLAWLPPALLAVADRRSSSVLAEAAIVAAILVWSGVIAVYAVSPACRCSSCRCIRTAICRPPVLLSNPSPPIMPNGQAPSGSRVVDE